ncbi:MAG: hypothetical protein FWD83_06265, partial [Promicromonosporaceae bacterium]|nr:hypothetical protein [Promicromonosporaceae bacterium]
MAHSCYGGGAMIGNNHTTTSGAVDSVAVPPGALFAVLHRPGETVVICHQMPDPYAPFLSEAITLGDDPEAVLAVVARVAEGAHVYHGVNPVRPGTTGPGRAVDVTRLAALWADLDVKPGALPSFDAARAVIKDLGAILGAS